jgi:hypothetical protein
MSMRNSCKGDLPLRRSCRPRSRGLMRLQVETMVALQIVLATGEFCPGPYRRDTPGSIDWRRDENGQ